MDLGGSGGANINGNFESPESGGLVEAKSNENGENLQDEDMELGESREQDLASADSSEEKSNDKDTSLRKIEGPKPKFSTMFVDAADSPQTDLLHRFQSCCQFIKQGVEQGGGVLVHWLV